jgi:hypothetical protein
VSRTLTITWLSALLAVSACATPVVDYDPNAVSDAAAPRSPTMDASSSEAPVAECDPVAEETGCAEGLFCETTARMCVACVTDVVRCTADGQRERCDRPVSEGIGDLTGGAFEPMPCEALHVCVPADATSATCEYALCTPGLMRCVSPTVAQECNVYGTGFDAELCGPGWACAGGACQPIRHNVLLIFDTSTSMFEFSEGSGYPEDSVYVYPACEAEGLPMTRFDLAKTIFAENIVEAVGEFSHFALQRFPQRPHAGRVPTCVTGHYVSTETDMISGDDGTIDTALGAWFADHRDEVLVVPFASSLSLDNTEQLLSWLDFEESLQATAESCTRHEDCPFEGCLLDPESQTNRCFLHHEPELRMGGNTPLGKSLFYAGEYFRRSVLIDGKPCADDSGCPSAGYVCDSGVCRDPYSGCRESQIVLFTDGEENLFQGKDEFFGPQAQAKRLAFGLHCEEDTDCRGGATCVFSFDVGYCVPPGDSIDAAPFLPGTGYDALSRLDGAPISIRTTVVNLRTAQTSTANPNATIARWGGGELVEVFSEHPESMKEQLYEVMTPAFKCEPDELRREVD